jgi:uncharacterized membrane protein
MIQWSYLLVLAVWIGSIVFFSFVVAPSVFKTLEPSDAAKLIRVIFSKYYLVGILCAGVGIVCVGLMLADKLMAVGPAILSLLLLAGMGGTDFWLRQAVMPRMTELREQVAGYRAEQKELPETLDTEWKSLHRMSVMLNGLVLVCGLVLLALVVWGRAG